MGSSNKRTCRVGVNVNELTLDGAGSRASIQGQRVGVEGTGSYRGGVGGRSVLRQDKAIRATILELDNVSGPALTNPQRRRGRANVATNPAVSQQTITEATASVEPGRRPRAICGEVGVVCVNVRPSRRIRHIDVSVEAGLSLAAREHTVVVQREAVRGSRSRAGHVLRVRDVARLPEDPAITPAIPECNDIERTSLPNIQSGPNRRATVDAAVRVDTVVPVRADVQCAGCDNRTSASRVLSVDSVERASSGRTLVEVHNEATSRLTSGPVVRGDRQRVRIEVSRGQRKRSLRYCTTIGNRERLLPRANRAVPDLQHVPGAGVAEAEHVVRRMDALEVERVAVNRQTLISRVDIVPGDSATSRSYRLPTTVGVHPRQDICIIRGGIEYISALDLRDGRSDRIAGHVTGNVYAFGL